jgi:hypothetical protein
MTIDYHMNAMPWSSILNQAKEMGYLSHQAGTCGLHIHVNRTAFGKTEEEQDEVIARILYFFEKNWQELLKFSRRTHKQLKQWATRYGLKEHPKEILKCAKGDQERYTCVNLLNHHTIELRMWRGTLKLNTLLATLQLVDRICEVAICLSDEEIKEMSWSSFVAGCTQPELIQYLKERVNEASNSVSVGNDIITGPVSRAEDGSFYCGNCLLPYQYCLDNALEVKSISIHRYKDNTKPNKTMFPYFASQADFKVLD